MTLRRGFRAEAERLSAAIRKDLGIATADPLPLEVAARIRDAHVVSASDLVDADRLAELERLQAFAFSACTFEVRGKTVIVFNPLRSEPRQHSDVAHELAHVLLKHELSEIREVGGLSFRTCRPDQEEEATTLGATLLLPRPLLLRAVGRGMGVDDISRTYAVTPEMARFRVNTTGVTRQIGRARAQQAH